MSNVIMDEEINQFWFTLGGDFVSFARDIERAVLDKLGNQDPIYMWRLEDDGWMECTKEWFYAAISEGYEKRIVYAHPAPQQAIPEWQPIWKAPLDGTKVDLWDKDGYRVCDAEFKHHRWMNGKPTTPKSWGDGDRCGRGPIPTHWMPIPKAPKF